MLREEHIAVGAAVRDHIPRDAELLLQHADALADSGRITCTIIAMKTGGQCVVIDERAACIVQRTGQQGRIACQVNGCAAGFDLNSARVVRIRTTSKKAPRRIVAEFARTRTPLEEEELTIQDGGIFTEEYRRIAGAFLLYL